MHCYTSCIPFSQKYVIIHFLQPTPEGAQFAAANWPLHITLASNFQIDLSGTQLQEKLQDFAANYKSIPIAAESDTYFGPNNDILVTLYSKTPQLDRFHRDLVKLLKENGAQFDTPKYLEDGYKPHATVQQNARVNNGDTLAITDFSLVDMFPKKDALQRLVMQTYGFSDLQQI